MPETAGSRGALRRCRGRTTLAIAATVALALVQPLAGAEPMSPEGWRRVVADWVSDLERAKELLKQGKHRRVRTLMDAQLEEMAGRFRTGSFAGTLLGTASALRAIAQAGLGDIESAAWDWGVAKALVPEIEQLDRSQFGAAGGFVDSDEYRALFGDAAAPESGDGTLDPDASDNPDQLEAPRKMFSPAPSYPRGKLDACVEEPLVVQMVVGRDGRPYAPRLLGTGDPVLFFTTAETLRRWRFEPARFEGKPVPTFYNLTVNFKMMFCPGGPRRDAR